MLFIELIRLILKIRINQNNKNLKNIFNQLQYYQIKYIYIQEHYY